MTCRGLSRVYSAAHKKNLNTHTCIYNVHVWCNRLSLRQSTTEYSLYRNPNSTTLHVQCMYTYRCIAKTGFLDLERIQTHNHWVVLHPTEWSTSFKQHHTGWHFSFRNHLILPLLRIPPIIPVHVQVEKECDWVHKTCHDASCYMYIMWMSTSSLGYCICWWYHS